MNCVTFSINGHKYSAGSEFSAHTTLNEFIRRRAEFRGTKFMCQEGGCGSCVVNVRAVHPQTHEQVSFSVNSCLVAVLSCDGWNITTIEGIGNRKDGYNIIQKRLNNFFGSQCGYCSPGFVMSMYSLVQNHDKHLSEAEIENSFGSNLCRCTGYRPILEAFKSFAANPNTDILKKIKDIEDIDSLVCPKSGKKCGGQCENSSENMVDWCLVNMEKMNMKSEYPKKISLSDGRLWYSVQNIRSIFQILDEVGYDSYMLVAGNTGQGVRPIKVYPKNLIDISNVSELRDHYIDVNLVLGANTTLTDTMSIFHDLFQSNEDFWYLKTLYKHMDRVAHIPVRNVGTLAGNLVVKNRHPDFQSDMFMLLDCVGATVTLVDRDQTKEELKMPEFLKTNLQGKVLTQIKLPPLSQSYKLVTYKISKTRQNAYAEVNSGFLLKFNSHSLKIEEASIVYGGINPEFTHAYNTEKFLIGRNIFNNDVLQTALSILKKEIDPNFHPPDPSPEYRQKLALGLFYKAVIKLCPDDILKSFYASGATTSYEDRPPVSSSYQEYDTDKKEFPITQPLLKREGLIQCAGEAVYSDDIPSIKDEVFASFVLSTVTKADIESIDATEALKVDGVFAVLTSKDIPGLNSFIRRDFLLMYENEELLASQKVRYFNQPVAIVVAKTQRLADTVAESVKVHYKNIDPKPAIFTIKDAIKAPKNENRLVEYPGITPTDRGTNIKKIIKGKFMSPRQYHYMMELHTTVTKLVDNGLEVYSSSQYVDIVQAAIAQILNIPESSIVVQAKRCGGAFGCKITRNNFAACATALVAWKLNRPCRMSERMPNIMRSIGKRPNSLMYYKVAVDQSGEIQFMDATVYINDGLSSNENENTYVTSSLPNIYDPSRWKVDSFATITDAPTNCFMRAPGGLEGISAIEHIMEHIAVEINRDPIQVRFANYRKEDNPLFKLLPKFLERIEYKKRQQDIHEFNIHNRWKKRAIKLNNMAFPVDYLGNYGALVSVYHGDGSVVVNIGGVEIGQGIFTKITQVVAHEFQIPLKKISVLPTQNFANPNNFATASSITTECCAYSVIRCCEQIKARLEPVRIALPNATWEEVVFAADRRGILLQANYQTSENDPRLMSYSVFGIAVTEVEIDVLTGTKWIVRSDIFQDAGRSINPPVDVGQVEGAFIQSLSLWMFEETIYNEHTGEIYTDRSWNYKIIGPKDIPHDFRVYLRRKAPNPVGILGSKTAGEPSICLAHVIVDTIRDAVQASRYDSGYDTRPFLNIDVPVTNETIVKTADVKLEEFLLY